MSGKHIDFAEWEPAAPLDEGHLEECAECRQRHQLALFLRRAAAGAPKLEPPPFFANRTAHRAMTRPTAPFSVLLGNAARRVFPALAMLVLVVSLGLYMTPEEVPVNGELALLLLETDQEVEVSMDDFIFELGTSLEEVGGEREQ